jgi:hypothetical protein
MGGFLTVWRIADHAGINGIGRRGTAGPVSITLLSVTPSTPWRAVEIDACTCRRPRPKTELPTLPGRRRTVAGRHDIPEEMRGHTGDAVLERLVGLGLAVTLSERGL